MAGIRIRTRHLWFLNCCDTQTILSYKIPTVLFCNMRYAKSARHVQFQEKEKNPTTELKFFLSKNFSTEISNFFTRSFLYVDTCQVMGSGKKLNT